MTAMIELQDLTRCFGQRAAVDHLNLVVNEGEIFGFVGPNGAGKTTTLRMIAGLLRPTHGEVVVAGHSVRNDPLQVKRTIGYMPDFFGIYPGLKVWEYMDFFAGCYNIAQDKRPALIDGLLELFDLQHRQEDQVDRLSRGMKQRLSLARTLIHDPQVLVLDEPAAGLDPRARVEIRTLMVEMSRMGKTVFFSTHILADVTEICTRVAILEAGKLAAVGALEELQLQILPHRKIKIVVLDRLEQTLDLLQNKLAVSGIETLPHIQHGERKAAAFEFAGDDQALVRLLAEVIQSEIPVLHFSEDSRDLEEVFMRATQGQVT